MKKLLLIILILMNFSSCSQKNGDIKAPTSDIGIRLDQILYRDLSAFNMDNIFEFDVYLERTDLGIKQPVNEEGLYTVDLPLELQPKLMYLDGTMCDRPRFPHRCSYNPSEEDFKKSKKSFLLEITFEDGAYGEKEISVPLPKILKKPYITEPKNIPDQNDKFRIKFTDVGADSYEIALNLCGKYENDGINPCLEGVEYSLKMEGEEAILTYGEDLFSPEVVFKNGVIELKTDFPMVFEESVQYLVKAIKVDKTSEGISTYVESSDFKEFSFPTASETFL